MSGLIWIQIILPILHDIPEEDYFFQKITHD